MKKQSAVDQILELMIIYKMKKPCPCECQDDISYKKIPTSCPVGIVKIWSIVLTAKSGAGQSVEALEDLRLRLL